MGRAGDSFNDVITYLVKKAGTLDEQWKTIATTV